LLTKPRTDRFSSIATSSATSLALAVCLAFLPAACSSKLEMDGLAGNGMPAPVEPARGAPAADAAVAAEPSPDSPATYAGDAAVAPDPDVQPSPQPAPPGDSTAPPTGALPAWPHCGEPPYQALSLSARDLMSAGGSKGNLEGIVVTFKHCPNLSFEIPAEGGLVQITAGAETWIHFAAPGYLPWIEGEVTVPTRPAPIAIEATMVPVAIAPTLVPALKEDTAVIYVEIHRGRAIESEACRSPAGVTLTVKDHPEAVVRYRNRGANAGYEPIPATSDEGIALVTNLLPLAPTAVELVASKPDCTYLPTYGDANSPTLLPILRTPLQAGAITHQVFNPARED
jgi:hypothetical protein